MYNQQGHLQFFPMIICYTSTEENGKINTRFCSNGLLVWIYTLIKNLLTVILFYAPNLLMISLMTPPMYIYNHSVHLLLLMSYLIKHQLSQADIFTALQASWPSNKEYLLSSSAKVIMCTNFWWICPMFDHMGIQICLLLDPLSAEIIIVLQTPDFGFPHGESIYHCHVLHAVKSIETLCHYR